MKLKLFALIVLAFFLAVFLSPVKEGISQDPKNCPPDKELCAKMLRFGKQAYVRGKYLDAKEYFRKAVKADPASTKAWVFYDQSVIFSLAEKVEKNANLVLPDVSARQEASAGMPSEALPAPSKPTPAPEPSGFVIVDDEGC